MTNEEIPRGPENLPLKKFNNEPHWLMIVIVDCKSGRKIREEKINYSDREARLWLARVTYWSTTNNYEVRTCAEKDYVVEVMHE